MPGARPIAGLLGLWAVVLAADAVQGSSIQLKDGRVLEGRLAKIAKLADDPLGTAKNPEAPAVRAIVLVDDELRRTYVPEFHVAKVLEGNTGELPERIYLRQPVAESGPRIASVGPILQIKPFDEFGRRIFSMNTERGRIDVIQGITEITPLWTKVQGLAGERPYVWDMRLATSSIPRELLSRIVFSRLDAKNVEHRKQLIRLYLQADRYQDARMELDKLLEDFPQEKLQGYVREVRQVNARRIFDEIQLRRRSGQHRLAHAMLQQFPLDGVAGEILQQVREALAEYDELQAQGSSVLAQLKQHFEAIRDSRLRAKCQGILDEMTAQLDIHTLDRLADFVRLADDAQLSAEEKFSLAASGWLLGPGQGQANLPVSVSLAEVRDIVLEYLREPVRLKRSGLRSRLDAQEGASPRQVARLLAHLRPPLDAEPVAEQPGYYELEIPGIDKETNVRYLVQLPPEYSPYRRYPAVVTLNGAGSSPEQQIDWWSGAQDGKGNRLGQGSRQGYVVIAVEWQKTGQAQYEYSAREHAAVLGSLRDACRRFSIDTNRVFLSGHSMGGDAAWDLGLAHPDLWAGVIPIVAVADKYCARYWENARAVPFYVVAGEMDGGKLVRNARDLDRYMTGRYDLTVVEYLGRGHEHFSDEVLRIFDWMGRRERNFFPRKFRVHTMRTWDDYFWWVELHELPARSVVEPSNWPPPRGTQPVKVEGTINGNSVNVSTGADKVTLWLSPELVDLDQPLRVTVNGRRLPITGGSLEPDLSVMLEDARSRGERQHPFWAKLE
jgi:pimeloyl-ACP methyl ester carboxylesterase